MVFEVDGDGTRKIIPANFYTTIMRVETDGGGGGGGGSTVAAPTSMQTAMTIGVSVNGRT